MKNREVFCKKYLEVNFNVKNYASFQRQLNRYDFKSITKYGSRDRGAYYHELFLRGRPDLCRIIRGKRNKGNKYKPLLSPEDEPCFYWYPPCYDVLHYSGVTNSINDNSSFHNASIASESVKALAHFQMVHQRNVNDYFSPSLNMNQMQHPFQSTGTNDILSSYLLNGASTISALQNAFISNEQNNRPQMHSMMTYQNHDHLINPAPLIPGLNSEFLVGRLLPTFTNNSNEPPPGMIIPIQHNSNISAPVQRRSNQPSLNGFTDFQNGRFNGAQR